MDTIYFNESILNWVDTIHTHISALYGMKRRLKIKPADYGYDSYTYILSEVLTNITMEDIMGSIRNGPDIKKYILIAHAAWTDNYVFWKNTYKDEITNNPKKSLNTFERNDRATTHASKLSPEDLELYTDIIETVFEILTKKIFEAGMKNLSIN